jgi:hypothetical protein
LQLQHPLVYPGPDHAAVLMKGVMLQGCTRPAVEAVTASRDTHNTSLLIRNNCTRSRPYILSGRADSFRWCRWLQDLRSS